MHRRQFAIDPAALLNARLPAHFQSVDLGDGAVLRYCPQTQLKIHRLAPDQRPTVLIGDVAEADPQRPEPAAQLGRRRPENLEALTHSWSVHWALVLDGTLHLD